MWLTIDFHKNYLRESKAVFLEAIIAKYNHIYFRRSGKKQERHVRPDDLFDAVLPELSRSGNGHIMLKEYISSLILIASSNFGFCPVCEKRTLFLKSGPWFRDNYYCIFCRSIPRQRALMHVLKQEIPKWKDLRIHESSPSGPSSDKLQRECKDYVPTQYYPDLCSGQYRNGTQCENLEAMSFPDASFDLVVTQDVFEHVMNPDRAFAEIARILRPGGRHIFTIPLYRNAKSITRAIETSSGIEYLKEAIYHANPVDEKGSLVVTEWGDDLIDFIEVKSGMKTKIHLLHEPLLGIEAQFLEVFISKK